MAVPYRVLVPVAAPPYDDEARTLSAVPPGPAALTEPGWRADGTGPAIEAGDWPGHLAQALAEALAGIRPARQVAAWTTEEARLRIRRLGLLLQAAERPVVRRVLSSAPRDGVIELTIVVGVGPRTRVIAARMEQSPATARWRCTMIEAA